MVGRSLAVFAALTLLVPNGWAAPVDSPTSTATGSVRKVQLRKVPTVHDGEHPHLAYERNIQTEAHRIARMIGGELSERHGDEARMSRRQAMAEGTHFKRMHLAALPYLDLSSLVDVNQLVGDAKTTVVHELDLLAGLNEDHTSDSAAPSNNAAATNGTPTDPTTTSSSVPAPNSSSGSSKATAPGSAGINSTNTAKITVTQTGSNKNGFPATDLAFIQSYQNTPSTVDPSDGGVGLSIEWDDTGYYAEIQIGSKGQAFQVLLDSGSADFWVKQEGCYYCGKQQGLGPGVSDTFHLNNSFWQAQYGAGSASGQIASDDVIIAGMTLKNHTFGVASRVSYQFANSSVPYDGLMGLAFRKTSFQNVETPIEALQSRGLVSGAIMGYALDRVSDGENTGEAVFGGVDSSKLDASTTQTLPLSSDNGLWEVKMAQVTVNGKAVIADRQVVFDTGTTLVFAPTADADALHAQISGSKTDGQGMYTIPCTTDAAVFLQFGDAAFQINPPDLLYQPVSADNLTGDCLSSIAGSNIIGVEDTWILGDAFIKNIYLSTDEGKRTVQVSGRTDSPTSSSYTG